AGAADCGVATATVVVSPMLDGAEGNRVNPGTSALSASRAARAKVDRTSMGLCGYSMTFRPRRESLRIEKGATRTGAPENGRCAGGGMVALTSSCLMNWSG